MDHFDHPHNCLAMQETDLSILVTFYTWDDAKN